MALILIVLAVLALDQAAKYLVVTGIEKNSSVPVVDGVLYLTHIQNPGAAFGLLPDQRVLFYVVTFFVLLVLVAFYAMANRRTVLLTVSSGLIIGGALGNLIDRVLKGTVTDYIDVKFWPVFNVADIAVVGGFILFAIMIVQGDRKKAETHPEDPQDTGSDALE